MPKAIKCENCGGTISMENENALKFCPYCGAAVKVPEDLIDLAKFQLKHEEEVRQRKVEEERRSDKHVAIGFAIFFAVVLAIVGIYFLVRANNDAGLDKVVAEVQQLITEGNYDEALVKVQTIRVEKEGLFDDHYKKWENQRKDLINLIEKKQKESKKK